MDKRLPQYVTELWDCVAPHSSPPHLRQRCKPKPEDIEKKRQELHRIVIDAFLASTACLPEVKASMALRMSTTSPEWITLGRVLRANFCFYTDIGIRDAGSAAIRRLISAVLDPTETLRHITSNGVNLYVIECVLKPWKRV